MNNYSFDDLMKQKAAGHEAPVPPGTWEAIAQKKKKKRRYPLFWWITGVALLAGGMVWMFSSTGDDHKSIAINNNSKISDVKHVSEPDKKFNEKGVAVTEGLTEKETYGKTSDRPDSKQNSSAAVPDDNHTVQQTQTLPTPYKVTGSMGDHNPSARFTIIRAGISQSVLPAGKSQEENNPESNNQETNNPERNYQEDQSLISYQKHHRISGFNNILIDISGGAPTMAENKASGSNALIDSIMEEIAKAKRKLLPHDKWAVDISITPFMPVQHDESLLYMTRTSMSGMDKAEYKADRISTRLQPSVAWSVTLNKKINPRLRIGAGFQYAMIKEKVSMSGKETRTTYTEVQRLINDPTPHIVLDTVETITTGTRTIEALNSYRMFSMPVSLQYRLMVRGPWSLQVNGGLLLHLSAKYHNSIQGEFDRAVAGGTYKGLQGNHFGVDLFTGFRISRNSGPFSLFAEPVVRYNLRRYELAGMINRKFIHQAGLSIGATYSFGY